MLTLDEMQQAAASAREPVVQVTAPAGSGKTRVLVARTLQWLNNEIPPEEVMATTFTRKAAGEMRSRLAEEGAPSEVRVGTIASLMLRAIIARAALQDARAPRVLDPEEAFLRFKDIAENLTDWRGDSLRRAWEDILLAVRFDIFDLPSEQHHRVLKEFLGQIQSEGYILLEQIPHLAVHAVQAPGVRAALNVRALAVDEWQDTRPEEFAFLRALHPDRLFVVGDPAQSIYGWRGVNLALLEQAFERAFPAARRFTLTATYRSARRIVQAAVAVLPQSPLAHAQVISQEEGQVVLKELTTPAHEAAWVADQILVLLDQGVAPKDIAVLMRTHAQRAAFEQAFAERAIPYAPLGDEQPLYGSLVARQLAAYLALILTLQGETDCDFEGAFDLALQAPPRGVGPRSLNVLRGKKGFVSWEDVGAADRLPGLLPTVRKAVADFMDDLERLSAVASTLRPHDTTRRIVEATGWREYLAAFPGGAQDIRRLDVLVDESSRFDSLRAFFQHLRRRVGAMLVGDGVALGTLHAAKGLEWGYVFVVGLNEGVLPYRSALSDPQAEAEERRLFHVGITRARQGFYASWTQGVDSQQGLQPTAPSRFLAPLAPLAVAYG